MTLCKDGLPERTVWLVIKRTTGVEKAYSYYISNAPASTPLRTFVWLSSVRWAVYLSPADKSHRLTRRLSQEQKGLEERALMASQRPSAPW